MIIYKRGDSMKMTKPNCVYQCCGHVLAVMDDLKGVKIKCPFCGKKQCVTQTLPKIVVFTK
jgi:hypothetical protein